MSDSSYTGKARNYFSSYGNGAVSFINIFDASTIVTNVNDGSIIGTGAWRAAVPADFAANISLSGVSISVGAVAVTGVAAVSVQNPTYQVGITGQPISVVGSVFGTLTGNSSVNVQVTGSPLVTSIYQGSTTVSNSAPSGANGLALPANSARKTLLIQNNNTGSLPLYVRFGAAASTQLFNMILKGGSPVLGDGATFIDSFGIWRGDVYCSGQSPNYTIWELT